MDSELGNSNQNNSSCGLLRFRSAPSSFFLDLENFSTDEIVRNENNKDIKNNGARSKFNLDSCISLNSQLPPPYPRPNNNIGTQQVGSNNLMRQNSSPAGLFSHLSPQNGYGVGGYRMVHGSNGDMVSSTIRLKGQLSFPSGAPASSLGMLSRITEVENESSITTSLDDENPGNGNTEAQFYNTGLPFASWSGDASHFQESFTGKKGELDNEGKLFANVQIEQLGNGPPILSHHLSLPKTPAEVAAMERLLQLQDTVPYKIRAKRGCATHPRSVAERVRRTRISERMRKLQDLVPNMDRQTNRSEMLEIVVEYIQDLQKQYKTLADCRANCKCSAMQKSVSNQRV